MKVSNVIDMLAYGVPWQLIGAGSGKKLCNDSSSDTLKSKYMDDETTTEPIFVSLKVRKNNIINTVESCYPIVNIWVYGR